MVDEMNIIKMPLFVVLTFLVAFGLAILPLPYWADWFRPEWVVLVVMYWSLTISSRVNVGVAWLVGLLLDVLYNVPLGQHALALVLVTYFTVRFSARLPFFSFWQKMLVLFGLIIFYQLMLLYLRGAGFAYTTLFICFSRALISTAIWLWLVLILGDYQHRFDIESDNP